MTVPFSAARTALPSGASILMPVPLELMKSVVTLPDTGQRNLSAPDICWSCAGAGIFGAGCAVATCCTGGLVGEVLGSTSLGSLIAAVLPGIGWLALGAAAGFVAPSGASAGASEATLVGADLAARSARPGMITFWPT